MNSSNGGPNGENRGRNGHVLVWEQPGLEEEDRPNGKSKSTSRIHDFRRSLYVSICLSFGEIFISSFEAEFPPPFRNVNETPRLETSLHPRFPSRESRVESTCSTTLSLFVAFSFFYPLSFPLLFRPRARARASKYVSFKVCTSTRTRSLTPFRRFRRPLCVHSVLKRVIIITRLSILTFSAMVQHRNAVARSKSIYIVFGQVRQRKMQGSDTIDMVRFTCALVKNCRAWVVRSLPLSLFSLTSCFALEWVDQQANFNAVPGIVARSEQRIQHR